MLFLQPPFATSQNYEWLQREFVQACGDFLLDFK